MSDIEHARAIMLAYDHVKEPRLLLGVMRALVRYHGTPREERHAMIKLLRAYDKSITTFERDGALVICDDDYSMTIVNAQLVRGMLERITFKNTGAHPGGIHDRKLSANH